MVHHQFYLGACPSKFYPAQDNNMTLGWSIIMLKLYKTCNIETVDTTVVVRVCGANNCLILTKTETKVEVET